MSANPILMTRAGRVRLGEAPASFHGMVGNSPALERVFALIRRISPHFRTVLLTGETGTGKELAARSLHALSQFSQGHFVVLNCSAVVETLFESELFGHTRGAFTGATSDKMGLIEYASGGTLFLDEIGDMPLATQAKLLRVLQNREVQRVGALTSKSVDVRVIAATNQDLRCAVAEKRFREDLFYRLSMVEIHLPPLRERPDDLSQLTAHLVREWSRRIGKPISGLTPEAIALIRQHDWPGNVRELDNVLGHASMISSSEWLDACDLPEYLCWNGRAEGGQERISIPEQLSPLASDAIEELEFRLVRQALKESDGNQMRAARILHTTRDKLRYRMKKYGLALPGRQLQVVS